MIECDSIVRGCDNVTKLTFLDADRNPLSVTGERIRFAITQDMLDAPVILKDSDNGPTEIEILPAPNDNCALVKILPADTAPLKEGTYCRSVEVTFNSLVPPRCVIPIHDSVDIVDSAFSGLIVVP